MDGAQVEEVAVTGVAAGGEGVGRLADGRAVFVRGALPGERVRLTVSEEKSRFARAEILEVLEAAPERVAPPCPRLAAGCGGCDWQHVAPDAQRRLKATIITDALRRIGRVEPPEPDLGPVLPVEGWRTTVRAVVDGDGRAGFRLRHAHDPLAVGPAGCLVAHPLVDEVLREGLFPPPVKEVTVRAGAATGERLVLCSPKAGDSQVPDGIQVVGSDELSGGHRAWFHEVVAGRKWRISAESFFQGRPDGADALVDTVVAVLGEAVVPGAAVIDLYSGVGLFAGVLGQRTGGGWWRWSRTARRWPTPGSTWPTWPAPGSCGATCGGGAPPPPTSSSPTLPGTASGPTWSPASGRPAPGRWPWCRATRGLLAGTPACWRRPAGAWDPSASSTSSPTPHTLRS